jgi:tripartite-type tricarboxylate transporter receptor subunit TctC
MATASCSRRWRLHPDNCINVAERKEPPATMRRHGSRSIAATAVVALAIALVPAAAAAAESVTDFYRGKTVEIMVGAAAGGGYDITARVMARHMGRHIQGSPSIIIRNVPGATSLIMTNQLYNRSPRDGTVMGMPNNTIPLEPRLRLLAASGVVAFDINRFNWIGSPVQEPHVFWVWHTAPATRFEDLKVNKIIMGATAATADNYMLSYLMNQTFGTRMEIVTGYQGQNDINLAVERGEVQGNTTGLTNLIVGKPDWVGQGKIRMLVQFGSERVAEIDDVPTVVELATSQDDREIWQLFTSKFRIARPLALPPDVPRDRVKALQDAFDATMKDPLFLEEAQKIGLEVRPLGGEMIGKLILQMQKTSDRPVQRLRNLLAPALAK